MWQLNPVRQSLDHYTLCDALYTIEAPKERARVQKAVDYIVAARNPSGGWRYDVPPAGQNDTSVTAWALTVKIEIVRVAAPAARNTQSARFVR